MRIIVAAGLAVVFLAAPAFAQAPLDGNSLTWLAGSRVHTNANGSKVYEAFIGPLNGVVTGTALSGTTAPAFTEFHRFAPGPDGKYGLSVMNSRSDNKVWNFTPLKGFEPGRVIFETADGALRIQYFAKPGNSVGAKVERVANGQTTTTEYDFKPLDGQPK